jgi:hypothetical protein
MPLTFLDVDDQYLTYTCWAALYSLASNRSQSRASDPSCAADRYASTFTSVWDLLFRSRSFTTLRPWMWYARPTSTHLFAGWINSTHIGLASQPIARQPLLLRLQVFVTLAELPHRLQVGSHRSMQVIVALTLLILPCLSGRTASRYLSTSSTLLNPSVRAS